MVLLVIVNNSSSIALFLENGDLFLLWSVHPDSNTMPRQSPNKVPRHELYHMLKSEFPWINTQSSDRLFTYIAELLNWNAKINLIGKQDWSSTYRFLIRDSLYLKTLLDTLPVPQDAFTLDLGAGAGLPGIPLRIVWPTGEYILVEPRQKRGLFLHHVVRILGLHLTYVRICRTEELRELPADLILSRAMCPWRALLPLARPLLSSQGLVVVFSNHSWDTTQTCPAGWTCIREMAYPVQPGLTRYFWVFSPMT